MGPEAVEGHPTPGMHLWGWMSPPELEWLRLQASRMESVVEIGCLHGRSSFALATGCKGTVYCIDPWNDDGFASWSKSVGDVFDNVIGIQLPSPEAAANVPDKVDMVFIDGAHDYDSVVADITCWLPKTNVLLCGHDYISENAGFPDVATAVNELLGVENIQVAPDTAIWTLFL